MIRRRIVVSGRVQGVYFRDSCEREARARRVSGWVRNLPDGRVEAAFEGETDAVDAMVRWARFGPPRAEIVHVDVTDEPPTGEGAFRVL